MSRRERYGSRRMVSAGHEFSELSQLNAILLGYSKTTCYTFLVSCV